MPGKAGQAGVLSLLGNSKAISGALQLASENNSRLRNFPSAYSLNEAPPQHEMLERAWGTVYTACCQSAAGVKAPECASRLLRELPRWLSAASWADQHRGENAPMPSTRHLNHSL